MSEGTKKKENFGVLSHFLYVLEDVEKVGKGVT